MRIRRSVVLGTLAVYIFFYGPNVLFAEAVAEMIPDTIIQPALTPENEAIAPSPESEKETKSRSIYPYKKLFLISAYYSPLADQNQYVTGSYEGDIRLNGDGVRSADNSFVYPGMIAAPSNIPFGTKMEIPGLGIGTVHDRGGAIVSKDESGHKYDRLDVWMGYGDDGLNAALAWGLRTVEVTVYGVDEGVEESFYLENFTEKNTLIQQTLPFLQLKMFPEDLWYSTSSDQVELLQQSLRDLGFYSGEVTGIYDDATREAVFQFQKSEGIIESFDDFGAGHFGIRTRRTLEREISRQTNENSVVFSQGLGAGERGMEVEKLQKALSQMGFLDPSQISRVYDENTVNAVFEFQKREGILKFETATGAGYFGPSTRILLERRLREDAHSEGVSTLPEAPQLSPLSLTYPDLREEDIIFQDPLEYGDSGQLVKDLQNELKRLGYLRIEPTGFYGILTQHAVFKLQQAWGLVASKDGVGAGIVGPQTRARLNKVLGRRQESKRSIALKRQESLLASRSYFDSDLDLGNTSERVTALKNVLKNLGYFQGNISPDFDEKTRTSVVAFQIAHKIVKSSSDRGAGRVGPKTREQLNRMVSQ